MKGSKIPYSPAELAWIEARKEMPRAEVHAEFQEAFERPDVSLANYHALCKRRGWLTGRSGRFEKGQESHTKGKRMPDHVRAKCAATQFKKGQMAHNARGHGHERIDSKGGYVIMIIDETNPWSGAATRPVHKHRHLWEQANGPVPKGHVLKSLDGDKTNCDPSNWVAVPRGMLPRLNGRFGRNYDAAPAELKPVIMAVTKLEHRAREARKTD